MVLGEAGPRGSGEHTVSRRVPSPVHSLVFVTGEPLQSWGPLSCVGGHWSPPPPPPLWSLQQVRAAAETPATPHPPTPTPRTWDRPLGSAEQGVCVSLCPRRRRELSR